MADQIRARWQNVPAALWSRHTRLALAHLVMGALLWLAPAGLVLVLVGSSAAKNGPLADVRLGGSRKPAHLAAAVVALVVALLVLAALAPRFTAWQRARFRGILGEDLVPFAPRRPDQRRWRWLAREVVAGRTWRQVCYHALGGAFNAAAVAAVITGALVGVALVVLAGTRDKVRFEWHIVLAALGVALVFAVPWLAQGAAWLDLVLESVV